MSVLFDYYLNIVGAGIISGAIVGAGSGFASSLVISNGNINAALQGALQGALGGGIVGGVNAFASTIFSSATSSPNIRFAAETLFDGVKNKIEKKDFFDGFDLSVLSYAASRAYKSSVGYEATYERGGSAARKGEYSPPVKGLFFTNIIPFFEINSKYFLNFTELPSLLWLTYCDFIFKEIN